MNQTLWQAGDTVMVRYPAEERMAIAYRVKTGDVIPNAMGWPHLVICDTAELIALYMPEGAQLRRWNIAEGRFRPARISQGASVRLLFPGKRYEVSLFYDTGTGAAPWVRTLFPSVEGPFYGWKVDLTSPFYRTAVGFDVIDEVLDIVVSPDRSFRWKDQDEFAQLTALGIYTRSEVEELLQVGLDVIRLVEARKAPFDDEWVNWRPPLGRELGPEPEGWQYLPVQPPYRAYVEPR